MIFVGLFLILIGLVARRNAIVLRRLGNHDEGAVLGGMSFFCFLTGVLVVLVNL